MSTSALRVATVAWFVGGAAWIIKLLLILAYGGPEDDGAPVSVAFLVGIAALLVAGAAAGYALLRRWSLWLAIPGALVGAGVTFLAINLIDSVLQSALPIDGWFDEEVGILGAAIAALLLASAVRLRSSRTRPVSAETG